MRSFVLMAVAVHAVIGGLVWWGISQARNQKAQSKGSAPLAGELKWHSPDDFQFEKSLPAPAVKPQPAPQVAASPTPTIALPTASAGPITISTPAAPGPTLVTPVSGAPQPKAIVTLHTDDAPPEKPAKSDLAKEAKAEPPAKDDKDRKSMLAVVATSPPPPPKASLPKAVAIDPAEAMAMMKAQQAEEEKVAAQIKAEPEPTKEPPPEPKPPVKVELDTKPPSKPAPEPSAPKPAAPTRKAADVPLTHDENSDFLRFITVSKRNGSTVTSTAAFAEVDRAIRNALLHTWSPPDPNTLPFNQRTAEVNMAIDHAGHVQTFTLVKRSGNEDFDQSVRLAGHRLEKVQATLPDTFKPENYEFQVHFHVE